MKNLLYSALCFFLTFAVACKKDEIPDTIEVCPEMVTSTSIEIPFEACAFFEQGNIEITFAELIEDTRCPVELNCENEGRAIITLEILENEMISNVTLGNDSDVLNLDSIPAHFIYNEFEIKLLDINPYPSINVDLNEADYKISLVINPL